MDSLSRNGTVQEMDRGRNSQIKLRLGLAGRLDNVEAWPGLKKDSLRWCW
jgi:hypothetical protein